MSRCLLKFVLVMSLSLIAGSAWATMYRWIDPEGMEHVTPNPPAGVAAQVLDDYDPVPSAATVPPSVSPVAAEPEATPSTDTVQPVVEIFVTSWCPYCRKAEAWFKERDVPFTVYDVEKDSRAAQRMTQLSRARGVPLVVICGRIIHGYSARDFDEALDECTGREEP